MLTASENDEESFPAVCTIKVHLLLLGIWTRRVVTLITPWSNFARSGFSTDIDVRIMCISAKYTFLLHFDFQLLLEIVKCQNCHTWYLFVVQLWQIQVEVAAKCVLYRMSE